MATKSSKSKTTAKKAPRATKAAPAPSVGQSLKSQRLARGITLKEAELATRIRGKYLVAIESDDYRELPHDVYMRGFVQSYASFLELDAADIVNRYVAQRGQQELQLRRASNLSAPRIALTPRLLTLVGGVIGAVAVGSYLVWQLSGLTAPPKLEVTNPNSDQTLYGSLITVNGHVAGGADVLVNDSPILVDGDGNFSDAIALQDGVNTIYITAKNRLGKSTTITRNILAHVPKTDSASTLPTAVFNGVAVAVQIQSSSATVTIKADGKEAFKGTMLPGTSQTFKAKDRITVSTTNAGATEVTITNSVVAGKNLGALGRDGEAKTNFEFAKDTQFQ